MQDIDFTKFEYLKKDFCFIQNNVFGPKVNLSNMKEYKPNIEPNLVRYFFKNILKYDIEIAPIEKVYFSFTFTYKSHICYISKMKLSYKIYCEESIKDELFNEFIEIVALIEDAFIDFGKKQINNNEYSLPNNLWMFDKYINLIENKICRYNDMVIEMGEQRYTQKIEETKEQTIYCFIDNLKFESEDLSLSVIKYIDFQFSKIEHLISLLYPLINDVKKDCNPYSKFLSLDYRKKIELCCKNINVSILDELSLIKEIHRNRFSHGFFSKEKELEINIPNFGSYYMSVGNKYKGFKHYKSFYNYDDYIYFKNCFEKFYNYLESTFPLQIKVIKEGIPIKLDFDIYSNVFTSEQNTNEFIDYYHYSIDLVTNMEW